MEIKKFNFSILYIVIIKSSFLDLGNFLLFFLLLFITLSLLILVDSRILVG